MKKMNLFILTAAFLFVFNSQIGMSYADSGLNDAIDSLKSEQINGENSVNTENTEASAGKSGSGDNAADGVKTGIVTADSGLNVRTGPWGDIEGGLDNGAEVEIVGQEGDWYKIKYNGKISYVYSSYVRTGSSSNSSQNSVKTSDSSNISASSQKKSSSNQNSIVNNEVPYYCQYDNSLYPGSTCQNTSMAMVLSKYGLKITPDEITGRFGKYEAQTPEGLADIFNTLAKENGLSARLRAHRDKDINFVNGLLGEGKPVIVHGWFTSSGHVIVLNNYDGQNYTANDPAGEWTQQKCGGYQGGSGNNVKYDKNAMIDAIDAEDIWCHEVYFE